jgi:hypothetical protein
MPGKRSGPGYPPPPPTCPICRTEDRPSAIAWELGFIAGAAAKNEELEVLVNQICDHHATSLARILKNQLRRRT